MVLSDKEIVRRVFAPTDEEERIHISPVLDWVGQLQPASLDVRLGGDLIVFLREQGVALDLLASGHEEVRRLCQRHTVEALEQFVVHPGDFLLATTLESFFLPGDIAVRLEGKSSWGRLGLQVHSTAGFVDPGFAGKITIEVSNVGTVPMRLYAGIPVAQVCFMRLSDTATRPYNKGRAGSKYFGQLRTEASRFFESREISRLRQLAGLKAPAGGVQLLPGIF